MSKIHTIVAQTSSSTNNQWILTMDQPGTSSYATGGWELDLSKTFSSLNDFDLTLSTIPVGSNLPPGHWEPQLNSPSAGKVKLKYIRYRYDKGTSIGNVQNQPSGVTVQATSGQSTAAGTSHTHAIDHDHASFSSDGNTDSGADALLNALGPAGYRGHTHTLDLPNLTGTSGAEAAHTHVDNTIYQHQHAETYAATAATLTELPNATNLSALTFRICASGVKA